MYFVYHKNQCTPPVVLVVTCVNIFLNNMSLLEGMYYNPAIYYITMMKRAYQICIIQLIFVTLSRFYYISVRLTLCMRINVLLTFIINAQWLGRTSSIFSQNS